jgi:DHA2 family multidrug resistance protein
MSNASAAAVDAVSPAHRIAALRSVLPADLSHTPLLGIFAVIMGAGSASLAARLLSLGLADLRGHLGLGVNEGAWIGTAFNAATMFIGPLTVYLGALLGARRVLLVCSVVFAIASACLPFAGSYPALILLLVIAGLSSGTFYPLTISFALLNVPLRYLALTLGVYATSIEGALNFAPSLYGFYLNHLSWTWMFWTSAILAPVMTACVYFGIPEPRRPPPSGPKPSFAGFLYASAGFALLFAALDQGQRLDWWRSGVFTALIASGSFLWSARLSDACAHQTRWSICRTCSSGTRSLWPPGCFRFGSYCWPRRSSSRSPWQSAVLTRRSSDLPCCGRRWRRWFWPSSQPIC